MSFRIVKFDKKYLDAILEFEMFRNLEDSKGFFTAREWDRKAFGNFKKIEQFYDNEGLLDCCLNLVVLNKDEVIGLIHGLPVWSDYLRSSKVGRKKWKSILEKDGQNLKGEFYLTEIAVKKEFRNKGIGEALVKRFVSDVKKKTRYKYIRFTTQNLALLKVFKKLGLNLIPSNSKAKGLWKRYYFRI